MTESESTLSRTGKRFFTWETLASYCGVTCAVLALWAVGRRFSSIFESELIPFISSFVLMFLLAYLTEPANEKTTGYQKGQKIVITIVLSLMIFSAVVGIVGSTTLGYALIKGW